MLGKVIREYSKEIVVYKFGRFFQKFIFLVTLILGKQLLGYSFWRMWLLGVRWRRMKRIWLGSGGKDCRRNNIYKDMLKGWWFGGSGQDFICWESRIEGSVREKDLEYKWDLLVWLDFFVFCREGCLRDFVISEQ